MEGVVSEFNETGVTAEEILRLGVKHYGGRLTFASSLGLEDQVIMDMIFRLGLDIPVFTLDTGRLFAEAYDLIADTEKRYGRRIKIYFPRAELVEEMTESHGVNLFYDSVESRRKCCHARKLEPLERALRPWQAWVCGLRREQSVTRGESLAAGPDGRGRIKINPLINWSEQDAWDYIREYDVPYNPLHDRGFPSIGCACCTRAAVPGGHPRTGRWWWETPEQKECGLHLVNGQLIRQEQ